MPKFNINAEFDLSTEIEPDIGRGAFDLYSGEVEDFEDSSSFSTGYVEVSGGAVAFTVEAEDEYDAESKAEEVVSSGNEVEDHNGLTWMIDNVRFEVEPVEEPMTKERAVEILNRWLTHSSSIDDEVREAADYLLTHLVSLEARLDEANARIDGLVERVKVAEATV